MAKTRKTNVSSIKHDLSIRNGSTNGEDEIEIILIRLKYSFIKEYEVIIDKKVYRYDFAVFDHHNLLGFIEFDGEQHFRPISIFGGDEGFKRTQQSDSIKNNYCKVKDYKLLRISYDEPQDSFRGKILSMFPLSRRAKEIRTQDIKNGVDVSFTDNKDTHKNKKKKSKRNAQKVAKMKSISKNVTFEEFVSSYNIEVPKQEFMTIATLNVSKICSMGNTTFQSASYIKNKADGSIKGIRFRVSKGNHLILDFPIPKDTLNAIRGNASNKKRLIKGSRKENVKNSKPRANNLVEIENVPMKENSVNINNPIEIRKADFDSLNDIFDNFSSDIYIVYKTGIKKDISYFNGTVFDKGKNIIDRIYEEYEGRSLYRPASECLSKYFAGFQHNTVINLISIGSMGFSKKVTKTKDKYNLIPLIEVINKRQLKVVGIIAPAARKEIKDCLKKETIVKISKNELPFEQYERNNQDYNVLQFINDNKNDANILVKAGYETDTKEGYYKAVIIMPNNSILIKDQQKKMLTTNRGILTATLRFLHDLPEDIQSVNLIINTDIGFNMWRKNSGANLDLVDELIGIVKRKNLIFKPVRFYGTEVSTIVSNIISEYDR